MTCQLYTFDDHKSVLDKQLTSLSTELTIAPYQPINDLEGTIILGDSYQAANYCRLVIAGKTKYYYITSRTADTAGRLHCRLFEDVLMTHSAWIKIQPAILARSFAYGDDFLPAGYPALSYSKISHHSSSAFTFGDSNTPPSFILVTAGRGYQASNIKDQLTTSIPVN